MNESAVHISEPLLQACSELGIDLENESQENNKMADLLILASVGSFLNPYDALVGTLDTKGLPILTEDTTPLIECDAEWFLKLDIDDHKAVKFVLTDLDMDEPAGLVEACMLKIIREECGRMIDEAMPAGDLGCYISQVDADATKGIKQLKKRVKRWGMSLSSFQSNTAERLTALEDCQKQRVDQLIRRVNELEGMKLEIVDAGNLAEPTVREDVVEARPAAYFILTGFVNGRHEVIFGDYERETVEAELEDFKGNDVNDEYSKLSIRRLADDRQARTDEMILELNRGVPAPSVTVTGPPSPSWDKDEEVAS